MSDRKSLTSLSVTFLGLCSLVAVGAAQTPLGTAFTHQGGLTDQGNPALSAAPDSARAPLGTGFTYQGRLTAQGAPLNGPYDFEFGLWDAPVAGLQIGATVVLDDVTVQHGLFTVVLDFGPGAMDGSALWLEIAVRDGASTGAHTLLTPRTELLGSPNAVYAADADRLDGLEADSLVRSSYAQSSDTITGVGAGTHTLLTNDVTVPTSGILLIWASLSVECASAGTDYARFWASLNTDGVPVGTQLEQDFREDSPSYDTSSLALAAAVPVVAGTVAVDLQGEVLEYDNCALWVKHRQITTLFVPFGDTGAQGVLSPTLLGFPGDGSFPSDER